MKGEGKMAAVDELRNNLEHAFLTHEEAVSELGRVTLLLEGANPVPRDEAERALRQVMDAGWAVRELLAEARTKLRDAVPGDPGDGAGATPLDALRDTVENTIRRLDALAKSVPLRRLMLLLAELRAGRVVRALRPAVAEGRRIAAIDEVQEGIARGVPAFPGPEADSPSWLSWFWSLESAAFDRVRDEIGLDWPRLTDFLEFVRPDNWLVAASTVPPAEDAASSPGHGQQQPATGASAVEAGVVPPAHVPEPVAASVPLGPPVEAATVELHDPLLLDPPQPANVRGASRALAADPPRPAIPPAASTATGPALGLLHSKKGGAQVRALVDPARPREHTTGLLPAALLNLATQVQPPKPDAPRSGAAKGEPRGAGSVPAHSEDAPPPEAPRPSVSSVPPAEASSVPASAPAAQLPPVSAAGQADVQVDHVGASAKGATVAVEDARDLPEAMRREAFADHFWMTADGGVAAAPWSAPGFDVSVVRTQIRALQDLDWRMLLVSASALPEGTHSDLAPGWLVQWAVDFAHGRPVSDEAPGESALGRVNAAIANVETISDSPHASLSALFCLLSTDLARRNPSLASDVLDLMDLTGGAKRLLEAWVEVGREGEAEDVLRSQVVAAVAQDVEQQVSVATLEDALRADIKRLASAAGGTVQRTHCRQAWDKFMTDALPVLQAVAAGPGDESLVKQLGALPRVAAKVFDRGGAQFQDRRHMDKAVAQLVEQGEALLLARERARAAEKRARKSSGARFDESSLEAIRQSSFEPPGLGRVLLSLVAARIGVAPRPPRDLSFRTEEVAVRPLLLEAWTGYDLAEIRLDPTAAADGRLAVARLLEPPLPDPLEDIPLWLAAHRPELLGPGEELTADVVRRVQVTQRSVDERSNATRASLRGIVEDLAELADTQHGLAQEALSLAEKSGEVSIGFVDQQWLHHVNEVLTLRTRELERRLRAEALREGIPEDEVDAMLSSGQRAAVIRRTRGHVAGTRAHRIRATLYRPEAAKRWQFAAQALQRHSAEVAADPAAKAFLETWHRLRIPLRTRVATDDESSKLRQAFAELFFQARAKTRVSKVQHRSPRGTTHFSFAEMGDVRQWVEEVVPNPNFLPQLSRFRQLTVKLTPAETAGRAFGRRVTQEGNEGELTILLAPGVEADQLRAAKEQLAGSARWSAVAIIDDLDICRIFNPGDDAPEPLLALLEVVAEQQPWARFCPYEVVEGQHVKLEMFVGRAREAEQLAHQATYGRIFSGRRLGKTALLRFVGGKESLRSLPSRNQLRVVFCSIAGMETEAAVAVAIERAILEHFGASDPPAPREVTPIERLERIFKRVLDGSPTTSVLCLLDEADTFYAEQTSAAASERQDSLSWWMSRHAEEARDAAHLPRLRFVFCGYLCTDQNRGVWENKGDVLFLKPLDAEDAVLLAAAPLARIGVDARGQADDIAFRCGYQPAVITRFGKELVDHLERTRPRQGRDMAMVEPRDVITVFQSNEVQRAIREACWLNFVGHPLGQLIFSGLLMVLRDRAPGAAVDDAPTLVREALAAVDPNFDPSGVAAGSWEDVVFQLLRELVDRSLLVQAGFAPASFRLRFPHHLPVLLQEDPTRYVQDALARIRTGASARRQSWVLPQALLHAISYGLSREAAEMGLRAVVVASQWPDALLQQDGGLLHRLEFEPAVLEARLRVGPGAEEAAAGGEEAGVPLLVVGGVAVARLAATRQHGHGDVELARTGRLTEEQVTAWIQRKRAAEFTAQAVDPMKEIMRRTQGIPILVAAVDRWLVDDVEVAPNLGKVEVERLLARLDEALAEARARLLPGGGPEALTEREVEVVRLVAAAWDDHGAEFREALDAGLVEVPGSPEIGGIGPSDQPTLRMLMALGLLPRSPLGTGSALAEVGALPAHDPVRKLLGLQA